METATNYARQQADGLDNIAPTTLQGQQAWQYAQSDNFLSPEEAAAVMRQQLEPYRDQITAKLTQIGYAPDNLAKHPQIEQALYSGQQTESLGILVGSELELRGRLRIVMTEQGPDFRFTPTQPALTIPDSVGGVRLSKNEQQQLREEGALERPVLLPENGTLVPTFLRIDPQTQTLELWRVQPEQLPTKLLGVDLTRDQQLQLVSGHTIHLMGLRDSQNEPFNAMVSLSPAKQSLQLSDFSRQNVALKADTPFQQQVALNNEGAKTDQTRGQEIRTGQSVVTNAQKETVEKQPDEQQAQSVGKRMSR